MGKIVVVGVEKTTTPMVAFLKHKFSCIIPFVNAQVYFHALSNAEKYFTLTCSASR
jgi:hypothetical protein